jgi:hypothetical protein
MSIEKKICHIVVVIVTGYTTKFPIGQNFHNARTQKVRTFTQKVRTFTQKVRTFAQKVRTF